MIKLIKKEVLLNDRKKHKEKKIYGKYKFKKLKQSISNLKKYNLYKKDKFTQDFINELIDETKLKLSDLDIYKFDKNGFIKGYKLEDYLFHAIDYGSIKYLNFCINNGANLEFENNEGYTPFLKAFKKHKTKIIKILIQHNINVNYDELLIKSCNERYVDGVKLSIENGANVNLISYFEYTPLCIACSVPDNFEIVKILIENGANINYKTKLNITPYLLALYTCQIDVIKHLNDNGAYVEEETKNFNDIKNTIYAYFNSYETNIINN